MENAWNIVPWNQLSGMAAGIYIVTISLGCLGSLLIALLVRYVIGQLTTLKKWKIQTVFLGTFVILFVWTVWMVLVPPVNFKKVYVSPDGNRCLLLEDITDYLIYEEIGWRLRARLMDVQTNRCLGEMIIHFWHSGFDDVPQPPPKPDDVRIRWSKDGRSAMIEYGWVCGILSERHQIDSYAYVPEIVERFQIQAHNSR